MKEQERIEAKIKEMPGTRSGNCDLIVINAKITVKARAELNRYRRTPQKSYLSQGKFLTALIMEHKKKRLKDENA